MIDFFVFMKNFTVKMLRGLNILSESKYIYERKQKLSQKQRYGELSNHEIPNTKR